MRINLASPFVVPEPHRAFAAITASVTALAQVIPASVFRAEDANVTGAFTANRTSEVTYFH
ncbi:MAG: hypothetical protein ACR2IV_09935 [Bryobacteraceae bacterium]